MGIAMVRDVLAWLRWKGRIRRSTFWLGLIVATGVFVILFMALQAAFGRAGTLVLYPPFFAALLSLMVGRLHDRQFPAWWLLLALVPVIGPILLACQLLFARGTHGDNRYGADPRSRARDYLQVRIHEPS